MALQSSSCTFVSLLSKIGEDDSDDTWIDALGHFCSIHADAFSLSYEGKENFLSLLKLKISSKCSQNLESNLELLLLLCDCVRISVRDKSKTETLLCENFIGDLLLISESPFCTDFVSPLSLVPAMALRCLINMMNGNFAASELFIGQNLNGLNRILAVLQLLGMNLQYSAMMHIATKLLYMLLSQRPETIRPLLHTQPAETVFLLQLALCLSPSRYDDITRRLQGWSPSDSLSNTPTVVDETSVDLEFIENTLMQSSAILVDDAACVESSVEEVELESVPSITSVGHVGEEWYPLFVETCKLIYALYSHGGNGSDSNIIPSIDMSLLYDLIADVILTPLRPLDTKHDESSSMQATCRRHALQLAMLSLDLQVSPDSICPDSSAVPLILQKLLARDGIKILCGLLDEHFAVTPATSFDTTSSSFTTPSIAPVVLLSPILVLLIRVATSSSEGRAELKAIVFPNDWRSKEDEVQEVGSDFFQQKMDPTDIPPGSLRANLIKMMTSLDSDLKRYCAELLYTLCDKESGEFVTRTGFGNAIALMQIKGLI